MHSGLNQYFVYILTNKSNSVFYTGVTNDLERRVYEHKMKLYYGFTAKYNCNKLVWYEEHNDIDKAIHREKLIKRWRREYKLNIINKMNSGWNDLAKDWYS